MDNVYENMDEYNPSKKPKTFILFDDMIANILGNKEF